ncbi:hypothetical protein DFH08DRAFT_488317 [Mycena albidolilacea]|uniref:Uncharacterized protein n=1 Tax=Mycena albidolilacea TaxID=1033008 RepID=A0AAD7EBA3_9AGAR|nr:hypothetical protein DFH08DRAFT_488317 [Mycena albidolilacea]
MIKTLSAQTLPENEQKSIFIFESFGRKPGVARTPAIDVEVVSSTSEMHTRDMLPSTMKLCTVLGASHSRCREWHAWYMVSRGVSPRGPSSQAAGAAVGSAGGKSAKCEINPLLHPLVRISMYSGWSTVLRSRPWNTRVIPPMHHSNGSSGCLKRHKGYR